MAPSKILLCDDDEALRKLAERYLSKAGYTVIEATDGEDGLAKVKSESPDLLITDIFMPGKDGLELIEDIRSVSPDLPIIAMSGGNVQGQAREAVLIAAKSIGALRLVPKPFQQAELLAAVEAFC